MPLIVAWLVLALIQAHLGGYTYAFIALFAMFLSGITDAFDGHLARKWNVVSQLGKMADPMMDKIFYVISYPTLVWLALISASSPLDKIHSLVILIVTITSILRDLWVTFIRAIGALYGADGAAMLMGKIRTAISFPAAGVIYIYLSMRTLFPQSFSSFLFYSCIALESVMVIINFISFVTYTKAYMPYIKKTANVS
jgi:phosphatidylglycerophosphate synthase